MLFSSKKRSFNILSRSEWFFKSQASDTRYGYFPPIALTLQNTFSVVVLKIAAPRRTAENARLPSLTTPLLQSVKKRKRNRLITLLKNLHLLFFRAANLLASKYLILNRDAHGQGLYGEWKGSELQALQFSAASDRVAANPNW